MRSPGLLDRGSARHQADGLLREGPDGDQLKGWPEPMRIFACRERPHPGARLSHFEHEDGYRYQLRVTNLPATTRGRRGQNAYIVAARRLVAVGHPPALPLFRTHGQR